MARWTTRQVEQAAPDQKSLHAARALAGPGPWSETGSTDVLVWGKCQGSGSSPYSVTVDLTGPAFTCTCPSRKFPCKHGLALLLLWAEGDGSVSEAAEPVGFAGAWKARRDERAARSVPQHTQASSGAPDPQAQARRREQRLALMGAGCDEFELWLRDLVRNGLAAARERGYDYWDATAGRLVDAQMPGLAERVREMGGRIHATDRWADLLLIEAGRWFTAVQAWRRVDQLAAEDAANVRAFLGWPVPSEEVLAGTHQVDRWLVTGVHRTESGRLRQQRTWLRGIESGEDALVLDFAAAGGALGVAQVVGTVVSSPVAFYPGSGVRRSLFAADPEVVGRSAALPPGTNLSAALDVRAERLAANPWLDRVPHVVDDLVIEPGPSGEHGTVIDADGRSMPLAVDVDADQWMAVTGGHPHRVFGELDDDAFRPLTVALDGELVAP